jgi:hypothetical protein
MSEPEIQISPLEVYAMVIARDALLEQIFTVSHGTELANLWNRATGEIDHAIRTGLLSTIKPGPDCTA